MSVTMQTPVGLALPALLVVALAASLAYGCFKNDEQYSLERGCHPEAKDENGCVTSFDCSALSKRSGNQCYFQGKAYERGDSLPDGPDHLCMASCRCGSNHDKTNPPTFICANVECPELFHGQSPEGCHRIYEHDKCCSTQEICGEKAKSAPGICEYGGKTYKEGQKFYPDDECVTCICQQGFNGSLVEPFCRKVTCNLELAYQSRLNLGCIPVFHKEDSCCPIDWRCPSKEDFVVAGGKTDLPSKTDKTCTFGNLTLKVGEKLNSNSPAIPEECACRVPPHPVCIQEST